MIRTTIPPTVSGWALAEYTPDALFTGKSDVLSERGRNGDDHLCIAIEKAPVPLRGFAAS